MLVSALVKFVRLAGADDGHGDIMLLSLFGQMYAAHHYLLNILGFIIFHLKMP